MSITLILIVSMVTVSITLAIAIEMNFMHFKDQLQEGRSYLPLIFFLIFFTMLVGYMLDMPSEEFNAMLCGVSIGFFQSLTHFYKKLAGV